MKKILLKFMCVLSALLVCVPLMGVYAEDVETVTSSGYFSDIPAWETIRDEELYEDASIFDYNDGKGFILSSDDIYDSGACKFYAKNYSYHFDSEEEWESSSMYCDSNYYPNYPPYSYLYYTRSDGTEYYRLFNTRDKYMLFLHTLYSHSRSLWGETKVEFQPDTEYYYFTCYYSYIKDETQYSEYCVTFISDEPIEFKKHSDGGFYISDTINRKYYSATNNIYYMENKDLYCNNCSANYGSTSNFKFDENMVPLSFNNILSNENYSDVKYVGAYTNCDIDTSMFSNTDNLHYGMTELTTPLVEPTLADYIDVKLTPEFGLNMDRVFDQATGQKDYFKVEVTNNSETSVQFCLFIKDKSQDAEKGIDGTVVNNEFKASGDWENSLWSYITDTYYYVNCAERARNIVDDVGNFLLEFLNIGLELCPDDYICYAELQKGNFYWQILKPGETFEDYIYWANVNILDNKQYSFICDAVPTNLDYPTSIFSVVQDGQQYLTPCEGLPTSDYYYDVERTTASCSVRSEYCYRVCNYVFSTYTVPTFSNEIVGGNSKITSGWNDTQAQAENPYYRYNMITESVVPVADYSEFKQGLDDVEIDFDNIGIDDVKNYVNYTQDFFGLIKNVLQMFPAIWALICFGLIAVIIIGILRFLKG